ncbi:MAG: MaoC family dehydratase [Caldilineaceae bacterium SB0668_bin_21]|nr:MaoC family dehydratase [Caldilineaceae bacterium SB0668_bin_21]MYC20058.1 MaoC family dehydratase [Caldilineaceae bacterium SB0662_bin_25]
MSRQAAFEDLQLKIGAESTSGGWFTVTQNMINSFADATLDHQWIHVDEERAARDSPFGATVAHGFFTLALIPHLTGMVEPDKPRYPGVALTVNYGLNRVRFPHPLLGGSRIRTHTQLQSVEEVRGNGLQLIHNVTVEIEGVEKPTCVAEMVSRLYFED